MNVTWNDIGDLGLTWADMAHTGNLDAILAIIGPANRRDGQHLEAARKSGAWGFVTADSDILAHQEALEGMLGIRILEATAAATGIREHLDLPAV